MCTVQVSLEYNSIVFLFINPIFRSRPHLGLSLGVSSRELVLGLVGAGVGWERSGVFARITHFVCYQVPVG